MMPTLKCGILLFSLLLFCTTILAQNCPGYSSFYVCAASSANVSQPCKDIWFYAQVSTSATVNLGGLGIQFGQYQGSFYWEIVSEGDNSLFCAADGAKENAPPFTWYVGGDNVVSNTYPVGPGMIACALAETNLQPFNQAIDLCQVIETTETDPTDNYVPLSYGVPNSLFNQRDPGYPGDSWRVIDYGAIVQGGSTFSTAGPSSLQLVACLPPGCANPTAQIELGQLVESSYTVTFYAAAYNPCNGGCSSGVPTKSNPCCPTNQVNWGGQVVDCCTGTNVPISQSGYQYSICCPSSQYKIATGGVCCLGSLLLTNGSCCPTGSVVVDGTSCCPSDQVDELVSDYSTQSFKQITSFTPVCCPTAPTTSHDYPWLYTSNNPCCSYADWVPGGTYGYCCDAAYQTILTVDGNRCCCNTSNIYGSLCCSFAVVNGQSYVEINGQCCDTNNVPTGDSGICCGGSGPFTYTSNQNCCPSGDVNLNYPSGTAVTSNPYCCSAGGFYLTSNNACCAKSDVIEYDGVYYCCEDGSTAANQIWVPSAGVCCPKNEYTCSSSGVITCCGFTGAIFTINNQPCCPSAEVVNVGGNNYCCPGASDASYTYSNQNGQSCCCLSADMNNAGTYCCGATNRVVTSNSFCCIATDVNFDPWTNVQTVYSQGAINYCCANANEYYTNVTDNTATYNHLCCPSTNYYVFNSSFTACCAEAINGQTYSWIGSATNGFCCLSADVLNYEGHTYCCTEAVTSGYIYSTTQGLCCAAANQVVSPDGQVFCCNNPNDYVWAENLVCCNKTLALSYTLTNGSVFNYCCNNANQATGVVITNGNGNPTACCANGQYATNTGDTAYGQYVCCGANVPSGTKYLQQIAEYTIGNWICCPSTTTTYAITTNPATGTQYCCLQPGPVCWTTAAEWDSTEDYRCCNKSYVVTIDGNKYCCDDTLSANPSLIGDAQVTWAWLNNPQGHAYCCQTTYVNVNVTSGAQGTTCCQNLYSSAIAGQTFYNVYHSFSSTYDTLCCPSSYVNQLITGKMVTNGSAACCNENLYDPTLVNYVVGCTGSQSNLYQYCCPNYYVYTYQGSQYCCVSIQQSNGLFAPSPFLNLSATYVPIGVAPNTPSAGNVQGCCLSQNYQSCTSTACKNAGNEFACCSGPSTEYQTTTGDGVACCPVDQILTFSGLTYCCAWAIPTTGSVVYVTNPTTECCLTANINNIGTVCCDNQQYANTYSYVNVTIDLRTNPDPSCCPTSNLNSAKTACCQSVGAVTTNGGAAGLNQQDSIYCCNAAYTVTYNSEVFCCASAPEASLGAWVWIPATNTCCGANYATTINSQPYCCSTEIQAGQSQTLIGSTCCNTDQVSTDTATGATFCCQSTGVINPKYTVNNECCCSTDVQFNNFSVAFCCAPGTAPLNVVGATQCCTSAGLNNDATVCCASIPGVLPGPWTDTATDPCCPTDRVQPDGSCCLQWNSVLGCCCPGSDEFYDGVCCTLAQVASASGICCNATGSSVDATGQCCPIIDQVYVPSLQGNSCCAAIYKDNLGACCSVPSNGTMELQVPDTNGVCCQTSVRDCMCLCPYNETFTNGTTITYHIFTKDIFGACCNTTDLDCGGACTTGLNSSVYTYDVNEVCCLRDNIDATGVCNGTYTVGTNCYNYTICNDCISDPSCGWCAPRGTVSGDYCYNGDYFGRTGFNGSTTDRPTCPTSTATSQPPLWLTNSNSYIAEQCGTFEQGPIQYEYQLVVLQPDKNFTVQIQVKLPQHYPLDLFLLQDFTQSFVPHVGAFHAQIPQFIDNVKSVVNDTWFGWGFFADKPVEPFGYAELFNDTEFGLILPIQGESNTFYSSVLGVGTAYYKGGDDIPESQLDAMLAAIYRSDIGWRNQALLGTPVARVILVVTDAPSHTGADIDYVISHAGNSTCCAPHIPQWCGFNNFCYQPWGASTDDGCFPAGDRGGGLFACLGTVYTNQSVVAEALDYTADGIYSPIVPIFLVGETVFNAAGETGDTATLEAIADLGYNYWVDFVDTYNLRGTVIQLSNTDSDLANATLAALESITSVVQMIQTPGTSNPFYVDLVAADYTSCVPQINAYTYCNVTPGDIITYNLTVYYNSTTYATDPTYYPQPTNISLTASYPQLAINIGTAYVGIIISTVPTCGYCGDGVCASWKQCDPTVDCTGNDTAGIYRADHCCDNVTCTYLDFGTPCPSDPCNPYVCAGTNQQCIPNPDFGCVDNSGGCALNTCINGICVYSCAYNSCCDDNNRCTIDYCELGVCLSQNVTYCYCDQIKDCGTCFNITLNDASGTKCAWDPLTDTCCNVTYLNITGQLYVNGTNTLQTLTKTPSKIKPNPNYNRYLFNDTGSCNISFTSYAAITSYCTMNPGNCSKTSSGQWVTCASDYAGCLPPAASSSNAALIGGLVGGLFAGLFAMFLLALAAFLRYKEKIMPSKAPNSGSTNAAQNAQDNPLYCQTSTYASPIFSPE